MNKIKKLFLGILVLSVLISTASAATNLENHIAGISMMAHPTSNTGVTGCQGCHDGVTAPTCISCHVVFPTFALSVVPNPTTVTASAPTSVSFTVTQTNNVKVTDTPAASGAVVTLSGAGVSTSGTTSTSGIIAIPVTPTGAGTINAIAELTGFNEGTTSVTVTAATSEPVLTTITVSPPTAALSIGNTPVFTATAVDQNGNPMEWININWTTNDTAIGSVSPENIMTDANGNATTTFTANAAGTATVTASNGSVMGSADVTVSEVVVTPVLTTITVSPPTAALSIGNTPVFTATAVDQT
ncbi:MAG TPA: Ig-like domain-containing protein, partial [Candidatus Methanoperedens sp.]